MDESYFETSRFQVTFKTGISRQLEHDAVGKEMGKHPADAVPNIFMWNISM
jgi:hypothetical protein